MVVVAVTLVGAVRVVMALFVPAVRLFVVPVGVVSAVLHGRCLRVIRLGRRAV
jgi:hypothetical protein